MISFATVHYTQKAVLSGNLKELSFEIGIY